MSTCNIIKYLNWYPFFIVKFDHSGGNGVRKLVISLINVIGIVFCVAGIESYDIKSTKDFITIMTNYSFTLAALLVIWYVWKKDCSSRMSDEIGASSGKQLSLGPKGWFIIIWNKLALVVTVPLMYTFLYKGLKYFLISTFFNVIWLQIYSCIGQLSFVKCLLVRHLQQVKEGNIMERLSRLRLLIGLNSHLNEFYSLMVTCSCLAVGCVLMEGMATIWVICRFSKSGQTLELLVFVMMYLLDGVQLLLMAHGGSSVCEELSDIQWELQRQASQEISSVSHRKQIHTVIEELSHTQAELSGNGFFTVNMTSVTAAIGFYINIMMIFIQFMRE